MQLNNYTLTDGRFSNYLIYALIDPRTNEVRYIGRSSSNLRRPNHHRFTAYNKFTHKDNWIKSLHKSNLDYKILVLEDLNSSEKLNEREMFYISFYKSLGAPLTNSTNGGEGLVGFTQTEKQRKAVINYNKSRKLSKKTLDSLSYYNKLREDKKSFACVNTGKVYNDRSLAAAETKCSKLLIYRVLKGYSKSTNGMIFKYLEA